MPRVEIADIEKVRIGAGDAGLELDARLKEGDAVTIAFPFEMLLGLISVTSMAVNSIASRMGRRAILAAEGAQVSHSTSTAIGLEIAFGQNGSLFFDLPRDMADRLHSQIGNRLSETRSPDQNLKPN